MRGHIDACTMRISIDAESMPRYLTEDPDSSLRRALSGTFDGYSAALHNDQLVESIAAVCFVAHERRHYDDYFLTNHGNHLANFWSTIRQFSDGLVEGSDAPVPIPIWFGHDPLAARTLDFSEMTAEVERASRYCLNYRRLVEQDTDKVQVFGGMSGPTQLECLATAFESAAIDIVDNPSLQSQVRLHLSASRNEEVFTNRYAWMHYALDYAGVGDAKHDGVAYTRTWPAFLVASLMGEYSQLTATPVAEWADGLLERVVPSHRLTAILSWCRNRDLRNLHDPAEAWNVVSEACSELFGATPVESMAADIDVTRRKLAPVLEALRAKPDLNIHTGLREAIARTLQRTEYLQVLSSEPLRMVDPLTAIRSPVLLRPDHLFYARSGFSEVPTGYEALTSPPFSENRNGESVFVRPIPDESDRLLLDEDETRSVLERYIVNGGTGREWIGPELDWTRANLPDHFRVYAPFR